MRGICTQKNWSDISIEAEKIAFPPKPDIQTDGHLLLKSSFATNKTVFYSKKPKLMN